ncbi:Mitochondrial fission protein [Dimargaris cristalligena]|nr:Mitochondrial fission protein [Dimargaris cristalligena]
MTSPTDPPGPAIVGAGAGPALIIPSSASTSSSSSSARRKRPDPSAATNQLIRRNSSYINTLFRGPTQLTRHIASSVYHVATGGLFRPRQPRIAIPADVEVALQRGPQRRRSIVGQTGHLPPAGPSLFEQFQTNVSQVDTLQPPLSPRDDQPDDPHGTPKWSFFSMRKKTLRKSSISQPTAPSTPSRSRQSAMEIFGEQGLADELSRLTSQIRALEKRKLVLLEELTDTDHQLEQLIIQKDALAARSGEQSAPKPEEPASPAHSRRSQPPPTASITEGRPSRVPSSLPHLAQTIATHSTVVTALDYHPTTGRLLTGSMDTTARVWASDPLSRSANGECRAKMDLHQDIVRGVQFLGDRAVTGAMDGSLLVWNVSVLESLQHPITLSESGDESDGSERDQGFIRNLRDSFTAAALNASDNIRRRQSFYKSDLSDAELGDTNGTSVPNMDAFAESVLDNLSLPVEPQPEPEPSDFPSSIAKHPSEAAITHRLTGHRAAINCLQAWDNWLVSGSADRSLRYWDLATGQEIRSIQVDWTMQTHVSKYTYEQHDPRGDQFGVGGFIGDLQFYQYALATGTIDGVIRMWDLRTGQTHRSLFGHTQPITTLTFNEYYLVSGSRDTTVRIWDMRVGKAVEKLTYGAPVVALDFDGERIASSVGDNRLHLYNTRTFQQSQIKAHTAPIQTVKWLPTDNLSGPNKSQTWLVGGHDGVIARWVL